MAWETRKGKGRYYTRSQRVTGRVTRQYLGNSHEAQRAADADQDERLRKARARRQAEVDEKRLQEIDSLVAAFCEKVEQALRAELNAAGYHQHDRGEWRKKRANQETGR